MICQKCKEAGLKSTVHGGEGSITCVYYPPWYDENGVYHSHDNNTRTAVYYCSNGHRWTQYSSGRCPSCDWNKDVEDRIVWHEDGKANHIGFFQSL